VKKKLQTRGEALADFLHKCGMPRAAAQIKREHTALAKKISKRRPHPNSQQ
jgi:hypothetical protein